VAPVHETSSSSGAVAPVPAAPQLPATVEPAPPVAPGKPVAPVPKITTTPRRRWASLVPVALATAALLVAIAVVVVLLLPDDAEESTDGSTAPETLVGRDPTVVAPATKAKTQPGTTDPQPTASEAATCDANAAVFAPKLPPPPRRLPWRPNECTQPPPGGPEQFTAVEAARRHDCRASLGAVQAGMKKSIDHCRLYQTAWLCFDESHQRPLESAQSKTYADAKYQLPHFEGTPEQMAESLSEEQKRLPAWYRPAPDGIEYRLQTWNDDEQMAHFVTDLLGEPKVADGFAKDLHLEALMAAGMACQPEADRTPAMVDAWARLVYVVTRAIERDRTGRILNQHRSELLPVLRDLIKKATSPQVLADGTQLPVPEAVTEAYEVAMGLRPEPTGKPAPRPVTEQPVTEPPIPEDDGGISVQN
jgi:hypothetical protein